MTNPRLKLMDRISRRYPVSSGRVRMERLDLPFTRIANPDAVLDDVVAQEQRREVSPDSKGHQPLQAPYWAELWESALAIGQIVGRTLPTPDSVLDLGCGMGLAGAAAAAMGARVLMADIEPTALLLARLNTLAWRDRVRVRRVDWQRDRLGERFDLILGADILYERAQWDWLHVFWLEHLAVGGEVLLGEPGRTTGDEFVAWALERQWRIEQSMERVDSLPRPIRVFRLSRQ